MGKRTGRALLALALLAAGCSRLGGGHDSGGTSALNEVCGEAANPAPVRSVPARDDGKQRINDDASHISYLDAGAPWQPWTQGISPGHFGALFNSGYYQVTDQNTPQGEYYASILSGRVYAGQLQHPDLQCFANQLSDDLQKSNYPSPNTRQDIAGRPLTVSGYPAYIVRFRLGYHVRGYTADSEVVTLVVIDTRQPDVAILYASIPNNVSEFEPLVDRVVQSLQVT